MTPHPARCQRPLDGGRTCGLPPHPRSVLDFCARHRWEAINSPEGRAVQHVVRAMLEDPEG